jgi:hypothetical protein
MYLVHLQISHVKKISFEETRQLHARSVQASHLTGDILVNISYTCSGDTLAWCGFIYILRLQIQFTYNRTFFKSLKHISMKCSDRGLRISWIEFDLWWTNMHYPKNVFPKTLTFLSILFLLVLTPCRLASGYQHFGETYYLHLQGWSHFRYNIFPRNVLSTCETVKLFLNWQILRTRKLGLNLGLTVLNRFLLPVVATHLIMLMSIVRLYLWAIWYFDRNI